MQRNRPHFIAALAVSFAVASAHGQSFVNWENPHVHPLDITPDGNTLLAVNTADNRIELFDLSTGSPIHVAAIPVGLDPVSVRARTNNEAWVINHISDSVSIVDVAAGNVIATIRTDDEPCDVVFAPAHNRAFVSCSQANSVLVFNTANLAATPVKISILGEDPRALAYSAARDEVYLAVFESGNDSTILGGGSTLNQGFPLNVVNDPLGPYGGVNPPPNDGTNFKPPKRLGNPTPPPVGMIVKKNAQGEWMDDNNGNWTDLVSGANASHSGRLPGWDLYDHDLAIINAGTLAVDYATGLMNICMSLAINPANGHVTVVGTDATNEVRFEPVVQGRFIRVNLGFVDPVAGAATAVVDLNQHLTYGTDIPFVAIPQEERDKSLGDPRAIVWNALGNRGYVAGMGSNNLVIIDGAGSRQPAINDPLRVTIEVGEGPTGLVIDEARQRLYVLNKFEASLSVVDLVTESETAVLPLFDPTPASTKGGRRHMYDTHSNSGLGHIACASCHVDARMDKLAWDLGDPDGLVKAFNQNCAPLNNCQPWHPMKGPMTTQTLQDIIGKEPHHWRGDRDGIEEFSHAFQGLQGRDVPLATEPPFDEMQEFEDFLASIHFPPNPFRNFNNTLPTSLPLPGHFATGRFAGAGGLAAGTPLPNGNAVAGLNAYRTAQLDGVNCATCHTLPTGAGTDTSGFNFAPIPPGPNGERHLAIVSVDGSTNISIKTPQLRNEYEKTGFELTKLTNTAGFGVLHDGSVDSIARFVNEPVFNTANDQMTADLVALMLAFTGSGFAPPGPLEPPGVASKDAHAAVGWQTTLVSAAGAPPQQLQLIANMIALANANAVGLVVKGRMDGVPRGWRYNGANVFQSDRAGETITAANLQAAAALGSELTYTVVPEGSETRIGIDRDLDGFFDRDEIEQCGDPADPQVIPGSPSIDINNDGAENLDDADALVLVLLDTPADPSHVDRSDVNCDGEADGRDIQVFVSALLVP